MTMNPSFPSRRLAPRTLLAMLLLALATLFAAMPAGAQPPSPADADAILTQARKQVDDIRKQLDDKADDPQLVKNRSDVLDIQAKADALAETLSPQLASVSARLSELGAVAEGAKEAPDVAQQRAQLEKSHRNLDAQIKLARLLSVEAGQTAEQISALRRNQFQVRLGERRDSVVSSDFWTEWRAEIPRDLTRLAALRDELAEAAVQTPAWIWGVLLVGMAAVVALRAWIGRVILQLTATKLPPGRLRRSFLALTIVLMWVATPGLIAQLLRMGVSWSASLSDSTETLLSNLVATVCFGGYVGGLGQALLSTVRPTWRLPPIPDQVARALGWVPPTLGLLVVAIWLAERLPVLLNSSLTSTITLGVVMAAVLGLVLLAALARAERVRRQLALESEDNRAPPRPFWLAVLNTTLWSVLCTGLLTLVIGYAAFGTFLIKQAMWTLVVLCSTYLLVVLIDDGFSTLLGSNRDSDAGAQLRLRTQAAVLLSGACRVAVMLAAVVLLLSPFGEGPMDLVHRLDQVHKGLQIGEVQIRPAALLQALLVLALSLLIVRLLKRWLTTRYLPTTELDPGMQISAATLFGYAGVVTAAALGLSALGLGLERVAWIASALSVGIGFGLQAVVQNFVSGLILLAERPVKVGDWVSLGGVEGDILRINVRATEIQMGDRSTVIVPNSEFITKTVRNVTHANPLGLVQIRLPMPLSVDAEQVRTLMLEIFEAHGDILDNPAAAVYLDGIEAGHLIFNAKGYVSSPRSAYTVRSDLWFRVLKQLAEAGLDIAPPSTMLLREPQAPLASDAPAVMASAPPQPR